MDSAIDKGQEKTDKEEQIFKLTRNLADAGCDKKMIEHFLCLWNEQKRDEQYRFLACYKQTLLAVMHQDQYKIDCLDHLVYTMKKEDAEMQNKKEI
jgi:hypothetical protein